MPIIAQTSNPYGLLGRALGRSSSGVHTLGSSLGSDPNSNAVHSPNNVQGVLKALETVGLVHTLAEPNLIAVSGETAKFLAGGEFPVPAGRDNSGNVSVTFKKFGVGLSFTPVVMSPNRISLQISTEVSELTNTGAFTMQGGTSTNSNGKPVTVGALTIPALAVRRAETTVELPSGGSFAIAGLMQHTTKQQIDAFPGLKDMPVLGALFRSRDYQNNETELVVMVSAYLVNPVKADKIALPTDGFVPATDAADDPDGQAQPIAQGRRASGHGGRAPARPASSSNRGNGHEKRRNLSRLVPGRRLRGSAAAQAAAPSPGNDGLDHGRSGPQSSDHGCADLSHLKLSFATPAAGLIPQDEARLDGFVSSYLARGNGALSISVPKGPGASQTIRYFGERLAKMGVPRSSILVGTRTVVDGDPRIELGYIGYEAHTDRCGDWSANLADTASNLPTPNFGCANQHNLAAMVSDPRDLVGPRAHGAVGRDAPLHGHGKLREGQADGGHQDVRSVGRCQFTIGSETFMAKFHRRGWPVRRRRVVRRRTA